MAGDTASLQPFEALASGLIAAAATLALVIAMLAALPTRFPLNPLYLAGSAFSIDTGRAYLAGLTIILLLCALYGVVVAAVFTGFELDDSEFAWGAVAGLALSIVSGTTPGYARTLNRAVRRGLVGDPGPFLLHYGRATVLQLVVAHGIFGLISAAMYTVLV